MEIQYNELSLAELRALGKSKGVKSITTLRKQDLINELKKLDLSSEDLVGELEDKSKRVDNYPKEEYIEEKAAKQESTKQEAAKQEASKQEESVKAEVTKPEAAKQAHTKQAYTKQAHTKQAYTKQAHTKQENTALENTTLENTAHENTAQKNIAQKNIEQKNNEQQNNALQHIDQQSIDQQNIEQKNIYQDNTKSEDIIATLGNTQERRYASYNQQENDIRRNSTIQKETEIKRTATAGSESEQLDSGETKEGILEVMPDGFGFIRCDNYLPGENDVYVSPAQIRRFGLKTGDIVAGNTRVRSQSEKFSALLYVKSVNGLHPAEAQKRKRFEDLTPIFPNERIHLEMPGTGIAMRMVDLISPIGKGQRGMIVAQPKAGKTTLLKQIAKAVTTNHPEMNLIILLIDERPEEVTDIKESIEGRNVEVIYSTFDELPDNHKRVSEMVIERAKRLVEHKKDVVILLDSITRLARAYNLTVQASGRTLSGGLDPAALYMPKRFFGAARNMREGGSLTILATALVDTGSRMDDVVFEEFKGTGNMELVLDRNLSEKRIFPAIDLPKSSTRREDLLLTQSEMEAVYLMRKALNGLKSEEAVERIIEMFVRTKSNAEFIETIKKTKIVF